VTVTSRGIAVLTERTDKAEGAETTASAIAGAMAVAGVRRAPTSAAAASVPTGASVPVVTARGIRLIARIASR
jgi:hypothetical protein